MGKPAIAAVSKDLTFHNGYDMGVLSGLLLMENACPRINPKNELDSASMKGRQHWEVSKGGAPDKPFYKSGTLAV